MQKDASLGDQGSYTLKQAAAMSGLNPHTLRAWERRYGVIGPSRTTSGRRLYTRDEITRLSRLRHLTEAGRAIGTIATLSDDELARMLAAMQEATGCQVFMPSHVEPHVERVYAPLRTLDTRALRHELTMTRMTLGLRDFVMHVVPSVSRRVGYDVLRDALTIGHEHLLSTLVRTFLLSELHTLVVTATARKGRVVVSTMEGDYHETGILCGALLLSLAGFEAHYLGPNTPPRALASIAQMLGATHVMLGKVPLPSTALVRPAGAYLQEMAAALSQPVTLLLGGAWGDLTPEDAAAFQDIRFFSDLLALDAHLRG